MMDALGPDSMSLQRCALQMYLALLEVREDWAKRLVLLGEAELSSPAALAAKAAGAGVLLMAQNPVFLREANQAGVTDFNVNSLSEAVRILKNEIRKGLPISVGLLDAQGSALHEMVERGLQPDALFVGEEASEAVAVLLERGARRIDVSVLVKEDSSGVLRTEFAENWRDRIAKDAVLLADFGWLSEPQRAGAVRWLRSASRLFPRDLQRCYATAWAASNQNA